MIRMTTIVFCFLLPWAGAANAQSLEDFLACGEFIDRVERVICLEEALEAATSVETTVEDVVVEDISSVEDFGQQSEASLSEEATGIDSERRLLPRIRMPSIGGIFNRNNDDDEEAVDDNSVNTDSEDNLESFGRGQAKVVKMEDGRDELFDVVAEIDVYRPNMINITLASGQVWRQTHARRYNLRKGDSVRIYPSGWGDSYRLATERLSGFIQVNRLD